MDKISCFTHGTVVNELESTDKFLAIHELLKNAPVFRDVDGIERLERSVIQREKIQSTGFGEGVAVAHGKSPAVNDIVMALGISRKGINFDAADGKPVHFLFLVANPPGRQIDYLLTLSLLVSVIRDKQFRSELLNCCDSVDIESRLHRAFKDSMLRRGMPLN